MSSRVAPFVVLTLKTKYLDNRVEEGQIFDCVKLNIRSCSSRPPQPLNGDDVGGEANLGGARRGASSSHMNSDSPVEQGVGLFVEGDDVQESSVIPQSLIAEGVGAGMRRWAMTDLSTSSATLIGGGKFGALT